MILQNYVGELLPYVGEKWQNTVYINQKNAE